MNPGSQAPVCLFPTVFCGLLCPSVGPAEGSLFRSPGQTERHRTDTVRAPGSDLISQCGRLCAGDETLPTAFSGEQPLAVTLAHPAAGAQALPWGWVPSPGV